MIFPEIHDLDTMTALIAGDNVRFDDLGPESRIQIVTLVSQTKMSNDLFEIAEQMVLVVDKLTDMEIDTTRIGEWFKHSKLFEGF